MNKKVIIIFAALAILLIAILFFTQNKISTSKKTHPQNKINQETILDSQEEKASNSADTVSSDSSITTIDKELDSTTISDEDFSDL